MARVYALRGLSRRFPQTVEAQLVDADRGVLASIRSEHAIGLRMHLRGLERPDDALSHWPSTGPCSARRGV